MKLNDERIKDLYRIWYRERNKKVFDIIDRVGLYRADDNWEGLEEHLHKIKVILITGETHENKLKKHVKGETQ